MATAVEHKNVVDGDSLKQAQELEALYQAWIVEVNKKGKEYDDVKREAAYDAFDALRDKLVSSSNAVNIARALGDAGFNKTPGSFRFGALTLKNEAVYAETLKYTPKNDKANWLEWDDELRYAVAHDALFAIKLLVSRFDYAKDSLEAVLRKYRACSTDNEKQCAQVLREQLAKATAETHDMRPRKGY